MLFFLSLSFGADILLQGARIWDGTGKAETPPTDLLISGERIAAIGPPGSFPVPPEAQTFDASGTTLLPGLIDSHVHISMDPGGAWRTTTPETHATLLATHLRALTAVGVTTFLDPAILPPDIAQVRGWLSEHLGPRFLHLGAPFSPPGGYVAVVIPGFPTVATKEEVEAQLDADVAEGAVGVKVTIEDGMFGPIWPLHSDEILKAIHDGARKRGLPIYVHAMSPQEQQRGIEVLGADVTVHPLDRPDRAAAERAKNAGIYEMTTLSPAWALAKGWFPMDLQDPSLQRLVPPVELESAGRPETIRDFRRAMMRTILPHGPSDFLASTMIPGWNLRQHLRRTGAGLRALRDAGVPLVMGSDSGNWPIIPFLFHGPSSIQELFLLQEAGFQNAEILTAATQTPAKMLHLEHEIGTVKVGKIADLLVVNGDPLQDLEALRHPRWTVRAGVLRTPEAWMNMP